MVRRSLRLISGVAVACMCLTYLGLKTTVFNSEGIQWEVYSHEDTLRRYGNSNPYLGDSLNHKNTDQRNTDSRNHQYSNHGNLQTRQEPDFVDFKSRQIANLSELQNDQRVNIGLKENDHQVHIGDSENGHQENMAVATRGLQENYQGSSVRQNPPTKRGKVIVMSYMRSGSTFTGKIFQFSPDVFFLYEPLLYTNDIDVVQPSMPVRSRLIPQFSRGTSAPEIIDYTRDMLQCNLTDYNLRFLLGLTFSSSMNDFINCTSRLTQIPLTEFGNCGRDLRNRCESKSTVVAKILRLKMWEVEILLARDPDLKVIHLVRDPRGIAVSRHKVSYGFYSTTFCQRFNRDAELSTLMDKKFPGRLLTVRYEDLAQHPVEISKMMYTFSGIPWSENITKDLLDITAPDKKKGAVVESAFSTRRQNSSLTAFTWRKSITYHLSNTERTRRKIQQKKKKTETNRK